MNKNLFKSAKPASVVLGAAIIGLAGHATYVALNRHADGIAGLSSSWAMFGPALLVLAAGVARVGLMAEDRAAWAAAGAAFAAWFIGSTYYASGAAGDADMYSFPLADALLLPFAGAAAAAVAMLVRARVKPFQPTILLDGLIISLAVGAGVAALLSGTLLNGVDAGAQALTLKVAYPLAALILLTFLLWVNAITGRLKRSWTPAVIGLALAAISSTAFLLQTVAGTYTPGNLVDSLWLAGGLLLAYSAWQAHDEPASVQLAGPRRLAATSLGAALALTVLVLGQFLAVGFAAVALAAAALAALISRGVVSFKESLQMFTHARVEALTDALTTLGNRRKLMTDLHRELQVASVQSPRILVLFDLDGFKRYNDTYGHPAGDVLLARLGSNLQRAVKPYGEAYRIGGDEFCVLVMTGASSAKTIIALASSALSEQGEGFAIKASHGIVMLPHEARDATLAMRIADQRMYAQKEDRRSSATRQARDILLQVQHEREPALGNHLKGVSELVMGVASRMSLIAEELDEVVRAGELHDVGKMAIPDEILRKPGPLTPEEWAFVRRHTIIAERILSAAPAMQPVAKVVRSTHEHWDGSGYPDGIAGKEIPLGARIVSVCDAFDAMITSRPYREARSVEEALEELRACSGTQFDPEVVEVFCDHIASLPHRYGRQTQKAVSLQAD